MKLQARSLTVFAGTLPVRRGGNAHARWLGCGLVLVLVIPLGCRRSGLAPGRKAKARSRSASLHTWSGETMGTTFRIRIVKPGLRGADLEALETATTAALAHVNRLMSTYDPDSELSRFNRWHSTKPFPVSADTAAVVRLALHTFHDSGGAFDVTVGRLVDLWGFGSRGRRTSPPPEPEIARCLKTVGSQYLHLGPGPTLQKDNPALQVDLSAVAKGFGVDKAGAALEKRGIHDYLVEVGGECRARGRNERDDVWRVGIDRPVPNARPGVALERIVLLEDAALATSGDYRNFFEWRGKLYSHTLDPHTGRPVTHSLASVSVIAATCAVADALATATMALGPTKGRALVEKKPGVEALLVTRLPDGTFRETQTSGMVRWLAPDHLN